MRLEDVLYEGPVGISVNTLDLIAAIYVAISIAFCFMLFFTLIICEGTPWYRYISECVGYEGTDPFGLYIMSFFWPLFLIRMLYVACRRKE